MADKPAQGPSGKPAKSSRDDRLKAALKANLGRRKAQARGRAADDMPAVDKKTGEPATDKKTGERSD